MNPNNPPDASRSKRRVLVVDDHPVVRMGLAQLINKEDDLAVCGEAENETGALEAAHQLRPDVALVDWSLKNKDAAELITTLHQDYPRMSILVLSIHEEMFYAERALRAGACGYVMKQEAAGKVVEAIRHVMTGHPYLSERAAHAVSDDVRKRFGGNKSPFAPGDRPSPTGTSAQGGPQPGSPAPHLAQAITVSIVIPVYNSEATVEQLCDLLIKELSDSYRLQIVLVDDGSGDRSACACRRVHERHPELVDCITLSRNFGEHNAVMAGLNCAEGDYCVIMDDDLQNPPSEVRALIEEARRGYDVVYTRYEAKRHAPLRNLGSRLHNWMATRALGKPADLYLSSFKVLSRFVVQEVIRYTGPDPYLDAIVLRVTRRIGVVRVRHEPRKHGQSGYTLRKLVSLWGNMIVSFSLYPLRLLGALGVMMTLVGVLYGLYTFVAWATPAIKEPDAYQKLNAANWFFRGIVLLAVGLVGEYVGRIYKHLTRDPQFIVRDTLRHRPRT